MPDPVAAAPVTTPPNGAAPAAAAVSTPPEPVKAPEARPDPLSPRFAALAKQTKEVATAKQELARERAAQEAAFKKREAEILSRAQKAEEIEKSRALALSDPGSYLKGIYGDGWYEKLTEYRLAGEKGTTPDLALRDLQEKTDARLRQIEEENKARWQKAEDERKAAIETEKARLQEENQRTLNEWQADTLEIVKGNPEKWELINSTESHHLVLEVTREVFAKHGRVLSAEEAADLVEAHLEEQAAKVYAGKKWQARLAAGAKPTEQAGSDEPARTLTNTNATGTVVPGAGGKKDRFQAALEAMEAAERAAAARNAK